MCDGSENDTKLSALCSQLLDGGGDIVIPLFDGTMDNQIGLYIPPRGFPLIKNFMHLFQVMNHKKADQMKSN